MGKVKECLGLYKCEGECMSCVLAFLCIETAIELDAYWDEQAKLQEDREAMELDDEWRCDV